MARSIRNLLSLVLLLCFAPLLLSSPANGDDYYIKVPEFPAAPKIDGKLENPIWKNGAVLEAFTQYEPQEGALPSEKTIAYIGYDRKNLYIAVRCFDSNPKAIRASLTQRDNVYGDDEVTIYLDTFNDKKQAFAFQVNPCGVQSDGIYTEVRRRGRGRGGGGMGPERIDQSWDTYFTTDAQMDEEGYIVELSIPFKSLRFPHTQPQVWGLQIMRNIRRKNEEIYWHPRSRDVDGFLVQAGTLEIAGDLDKGKNFEIMPVFTSLKERGEKVDPEASLNLKYGITSDLTGDFTYNPDFSQVEADMPQIDVNQRYALYYPEKRPFFLEGKDNFSTPLELAYTRKIVDPQWGGKLTGKIGKTTLGFLSTYDLNPRDIHISSESDDEEDEEENGDLALVNVFRLKRDLFPESYIGFILTDKEMGFSWGNITQNYNRVAGVDGHFKFLNIYRFSFQVVGSKTKVGIEETDIIPAMTFSLNRGGRHLGFSLDYTHIPPDFEASLGFFRRKDIRSINTRLSYAFLPQTNLIVDIRPSIEYRRIYDFDDVLTDEELQLGFFMSGWRGTHVWAHFSNELERYEGINFRKNSFRANFSSSPFSWLSGNINFSFGDSIYYSDEGEEDPYLGYKTSLGFRFTFKPITNLRMHYNFKNDIFSRTKGGEKVYTVNIISQRINYQLSRPLSLRLITDYNDYHKEIYTSILLSYEYRPGTVFYFGIDDNQEKDDSGIYRVQGRYYFIKFSYWWRI